MDKTIFQQNPLSGKCDCIICHQKHSRLLHKIKFTRKKINEGTLEEWKRVMFEEISEIRDLTIHTGGRNRKTKF